MNLNHYDAEELTVSSDDFRFDWEADAGAALHRFYKRARYAGFVRFVELISPDLRLFFFFFNFSFFSNHEKKKYRNCFAWVRKVDYSNGTATSFIEKVPAERRRHLMVRRMEIKDVFSEFWIESHRIKIVLYSIEAFLFFQINFIIYL